MIEKMKKITLLVSEKDRNSFVSTIRKAGVVHIHPVKEPVSHDIKFIEDRIARINRMLHTLEPFAGEAQEGGLECSDIKLLETEQRVSEAASERETLQAQIEDLKGQIEWFEEWGEFDPKDLRLLKDKDIEIRLFKLNKEQLTALGEEQKFWTIKKTKTHDLVALLNAAEGELPGEEIMPPKHSPRRMKEYISEKEKRIAEIEEELRKIAGWVEAMSVCKAHLERDREFQTVKHGMQEEGKFSFLQGYCPEKFLDKVKKVAEEEKAGYVLEDPEDPEETPTLITNPKWIDIIRPVFQFMNTLPGYDEFDISGVFLVFFSLFFAMLVGDAGYGLVFILTTFLARRKARKAPPQPFFLMYLMGFSTLIWGALTGTWFGSETIAQLPGLRSLVWSKVNSFGDTQDFLIYFCFIIGAIQLTIAHLLRFVREINSPRSVAQIGWVSIVWGMFFAAGTLVVKRPFPSVGGWLLAGGILLVLVFNEFQKNILKGIGSTLTSLPLNVISAFSDVVSYLRLFAVGYATVVLASTFNGMAIGDGINSVTGGIIAALILFLGHTLNILLAMMAVIVHGIRLNMLEFSANHMGMQWSGKEYEPFSEQKT